ncbi:MAG: hypothetical protein BGP15_18970 [Sphingobacterium sp. 40-24]|nr:MAG: hypothetical protein BGP15_18970 [Sphingobacterium sp. 40-24]
MHIQSLLSDLNSAKEFGFSISNFVDNVYLLFTGIFFKQHILKIGKIVVFGDGALFSAQHHPQISFVFRDNLKKYRIVPHSKILPNLYQFSR